MTPQRERLFLQVNNSDQLCLHRFRLPSANRGPVFLLHGAVENARIFFAEDRPKGLAYFLAHQGYDVFAADLRGRGNSTPAINASSTYGQHEAIMEDIPCFLSAIANLYPGSKQIWMAHSWGGVLMSSYLARFPEMRNKVSHCVYFGSKRRVEVRNLQRLFYIDLIWHQLCALLSALYGYLPAKTFRIGSDNETAGSLKHSRLWVKAYSKWVDPDDGFDYAGVWQAASPAHPPVLSLTGQNDTCLGHPDDVNRFQAEIGSTPCVILGQAHGARHNYDHISILTHSDAVQDHFPKVIDWLDCTNRHPK